MAGLEKVIGTLKASSCTSLNRRIKQHSSSFEKYDELNTITQGKAFTNCLNQFLTWQINVCLTMVTEELFSVYTSLIIRVMLSRPFKPSSFNAAKINIS